MHISCPANLNKHKISTFWPILKLFIDIGDQMSFFKKKNYFLKFEVVPTSNFDYKQKKAKISKFDDFL